MEVTLLKIRILLDTISISVPIGVGTKICYLSFLGLLPSIDFLDGIFLIISGLVCLFNFKKYFK